MKKLSILILCVVFAGATLFAQGVKSEIEKAQKAGKSMFLIVTDKSANGVDELEKLAKEAAKKAKAITVVKLDRDDKLNADLITKYRLAGAPLPLILVVAANGVATGSLTSDDATVDKLLSYVPTKNQAEVLAGFESGKPALIICGAKKSGDVANLEAECKKAVASLSGKATQVFVDVNSKEEANFLALIKPDKEKTTVMIFNGKGQFTGTLEATAKSDEIVKMVNKKVGGCCPGGSGSSGCGKK